MLRREILQKQSIQDYHIKVDDKIIKVNFLYNFWKEGELFIIIDDQNLRITLKIKEGYSRLKDVCDNNVYVPNIYLQEFFNESGIKGLGHKVLCVLLNTLIKKRLIYYHDEIGWEATTDYPQINKLLLYYESIGGKMIETKDMSCNILKGMVLMKSTISNMIEICEKKGHI